MLRTSRVGPSGGPGEVESAERVESIFVKNLGDLDSVEYSGRRFEVEAIAEFVGGAPEMDVGDGRAEASRGSFEGEFAVERVSLRSELEEFYPPVYPTAAEYDRTPFQMSISDLESLEGKNKKII